MTTDTQMRADFEKWVSRRYPQAGATDADDRFENHLWECWQAALQINATAQEPSVTGGAKRATPASAAPISAQEALDELVKHFPTDTDMLQAGWSAKEVAAACDAYDKARAALGNASEPVLACIECGGPVQWRCPACAINNYGAPTGNAPDGWVPVSERLPAEDGEYLCAYKHPQFGSVHCMDVVRFSEAFRAFSRKHGQEITHWMPLPAAPLDSKGST